MNSYTANMIMRHADTNNDKHIDVQELLIFSSQDLDGDKHANLEELGYGRKTARIWLAQLLHHDDINPDHPILADNKISIDELRHKSGVLPTVDLFQEGSYTPGGSLRVKDAHAQSLLDRADAML